MHPRRTEQTRLGFSALIGEFALPKIVVLSVRKGQIVLLRDPVNILAAAAAIGCSDGGERAV